MPLTNQHPAFVVTHTDEHVLVDLGAPRTCLSNAAIGGGLGEARYIINRTVPKGWCPDDPVAEMQAYLRSCSLEPAHCIGLLTAVHVRNTVHRQESYDGWSVEALVTTGVRNAARAGGVFPLSAEAPGTINIILLVQGALPPAAMMDAVQVAVEAKSAALAEGGVQTAMGEVATGTTTDTVTVVCLGDHPRLPYSGTATPVGYCIGRVVHAAVQEGLGPALARVASDKDSR